MVKYFVIFTLLWCLAWLCTGIISGFMWAGWGFA
jgi:hypothetical protein